MQGLLVVTKKTFQQDYLQILKKCFFDTTSMVIYVTDSIIQPQPIVLFLKNKSLIISRTLITQRSKSQCVFIIIKDTVNLEKCKKEDGSFTPFTVVNCVLTVVNLI